MMTDKEKIDKIIDMFQWKGYRFNKNDDIVDFMKDYIKEAEDNKENIEFAAEELRCDGDEMYSKAKIMNSDFDAIYEIAKKYYNKVKDEVGDEISDEILKDFNTIADTSEKYV